MIVDRTSSVTCHLTPLEAMEVINEVLKIPNISKQTMEPITFFRGMSELVDCGHHDEFNLIVKVRRTQE